MNAQRIADSPAGATPGSPQSLGRIAGASYLGIFVAGGLYMLLIPHNGLLDHNDAATVEYIVSHQAAFWAGYAFFLVSAAFRLVQMLLFYELFKPVNKNIALLGVSFNIVATTLQAVMAIALVVPLVLLTGQHPVTAFTPNQVHALAVAAVQTHIPIYSIALVFFGVYDLLIGYLTFTSTFLPRLVGVLMMITGVAWLTFLIPPFAAQLSPVNVDAGAIGEVAMILWLLVMGVDAQRWNERAGAARASASE